VHPPAASPLPWHGLALFASQIVMPYHRLARWTPSIFEVDFAATDLKGAGRLQCSDSAADNLQVIVQTRPSAHRTVRSGKVIQ
jgi:hypothetical protein